MTTRENFAGTDHCLQTGSYFGKLCTDPYGIYFAWDSSPHLTRAFAGKALQLVRRDTAGKSFGAIAGNQDTSALFMSCVQTGHHIFFGLLINYSK